MPWLGLRFWHHERQQASGWFFCTLQSHFQAGHRLRLQGLRRACRLSIGCRGRQRLGSAGRLQVAHNGTAETAHHCSLHIVAVPICLSPRQTIAMHTQQWATHSMPCTHSHAEHCLQLGKGLNQLFAPGLFAAVNKGVPCGRRAGLQRRASHAAGTGWAALRSPGSAAGPPHRAVRATQASAPPTALPRPTGQ